MPTTEAVLSKVREIETICAELAKLVNEAHERERDQHEDMQELATRYNLVTAYAMRLHNTLAVAVSVSDTNGITSAAWVDTLKAAGIKLDGLRPVESVNELLMWCS